MNASNPGADTDSESTDEQQQSVGRKGAWQLANKLNALAIRCTECGHTGVQATSHGQRTRDETVTIQVIECEACRAQIVTDPDPEVVDALVAGDIQSAGAE